MEKHSFHKYFCAVSFCVFHLSALIKALKIGVTIDAHFDYHDSITVTETTIMILSLSRHTIMILSTWLRVEKMSFEQSKHVVIVCIHSVLDLMLNHTRGVPAYTQSTQLL